MLSRVEQTSVALHRVKKDLITDGQARLEHLVDQASKSAVHTLARLCTRLKRVHALLSAQICQLLGRHLPLLGQVTFVSHDDNWNVADLRQLLDPFAYADERIGIRQIKDHQTGIQALDIRADDVCVGLLPCRVPYLHLRHCVSVNANVDGFCVCPERLDLFDAKPGLWINVL